MRANYRIDIRRSLALVLGSGLLVAGLVLIAVDAVFAPRPPLAAPSPLASLTAPLRSAGASPTRDPLAPIPDGYRIQMPRLGIDLPIAEGDIARDVDQQKTPEGFAFHLPGTSIPGLGSNTYLYSHARVGMFLSLWNATPGDEVFISTPDHKAIRYVVSEVHPRVPPEDTSWIQPTPGERLTLQTSTGPSPSDPRFVVVAVPSS